MTIGMELAPEAPPCRLSHVKRDVDAQTHAPERGRTGVRRRNFFDCPLQPPNPFSVEFLNPECLGSMLICPRDEPDREAPKPEKAQQRLAEYGRHQSEEDDPVEGWRGECEGTPVQQGPATQYVRAEWRSHAIATECSNSARCRPVNS